MSRNECSLESLVLDNSSNLDPALRQHVSACANCAEALEADRWMTQLARHTEPIELPDPARIWLRATLLRARQSSRQATRPIEMLQTTSYLALVAAWAAAGLWQLPHLLGWIDRIRSHHVILTGGNASPFAPEVFWVFAGLAMITVTMSVHAILQQD